MAANTIIGYFYLHAMDRLRLLLFAALYVSGGAAAQQTGKVSASANTLQPAPAGRSIKPFQPPKAASLSDAAVARTPKRFFGHPEFGQTAWNAPCESCPELIHERTAYKRMYIDWQDPDKFYLQQSYAPPHYRDADGWRRTIDPNLAPTETPGVYRAASQPHPVELNLNEGYAKLTLAPGMELEQAANSKLFIANPFKIWDFGGLLIVFIFWNN